MNIEQAKAVPIVTILDKLNIQPQRERTHERWYLAPWRNERTASLKVHLAKNVWYDHGEGIGGDTVAFVCKYLSSINEAHTIADALRWIKNMAGFTPIIRPVNYADSIVRDETPLVITDVKSLGHNLLINYVRERGIPFSLAQKYLKEVRIYNKDTRKRFFALGFSNEENGFELRNQFFKGCVGPKAISFIRGAFPKPEGIHVFEGFMDYLSAMADQEVKRFNDDTIVLNSISNLQAATPYIKNYGYKIAYTWMDNDKAGFKATKAMSDFFKTEEDLRHKAMNRLYADSKDVNAARMKKLKLGE